MKVSVYPTFTLSGWSTDISVIVDDILANAFASNADQSYIYEGRVFSVQKTINDAMPDVLLTIERLEEGFKRSLEAVLDTVVVKITHADSNSETGADAGVRLIVKVDVADEKGQFTTTGFMEAKKGQFATWNKYINTGSTNIM